MAKPNKTNKADKPKKQYNIKAKAFGFFELLTVASIAFTTTIVILGTDSVVNMVLVAPQALWAVVTLIRRFAS